MSTNPEYFERLAGRAKEFGDERELERRAAAETFLDQWDQLHRRLRHEYDHLLALSIEHADRHEDADSARLLAVASGVWTAIHLLDLMRPQ